MRDLTDEEIDIRVQPCFRKSADLESQEQFDAMESIARDNYFSSFTDMCRQMAKWHIEGSGVFVVSDYP